MVKFLLAAARAVVNVVKRFIANVPMNPYEETIFNAIKTLARQFGKAATA